MGKVFGSLILVLSILAWTPQSYGSACFIPLESPQYSDRNGIVRTPIPTQVAQEIDDAQKILMRIPNRVVIYGDPGTDRGLPTLAAKLGAKGFSTLVSEGRTTSHFKNLTSPEPVIQFKHSFAAKLVNIHGSSGLIFQPGGVETLNALFQAMTLIQTKKLEKRPIVLLGSRYWSGLENFIKETLAKEKTIAPDDVNLFHITDSIEEAVEFIDSHRPDTFGQYRVQPGLPWVSGAEIEKEMLAGKDVIDRLEQELGRPIISVSAFGGARIPRGKPAYNLSVDLSGRLAPRGITIITGGGPGIMEAYNRGAKEKNQPTVGFNIELPWEQKPNEYIDPKHLYTFKYFEPRKTNLIYHADAIIVNFGGYGTMEEFFEPLALMSTGEIPRKPILLLGGRWKALLDALRIHMRVELPNDVVFLDVPEVTPPELNGELEREVLKALKYAAHVLK